MVLEFKIGSTVVEEPIGFDSFEVTLERGSEHGIGAESSVGTVEFYGVGFGIVKDAYLADLDTQLVFTVGMKCSDADTTFTQIYSGVIDLTSYVENTGDFCSCQVSIGEIGSMTTFINRADTEVNLVDGVMADLDGNTLSSVQLSKTVSIPSKELTLTDKLYNPIEYNPTLIGTAEQSGGYDDFLGIPIVVGFNSINMNELGFTSSGDEFREIIYSGIKINEIQNTIISTSYTININIDIILMLQKDIASVAVFGDILLKVIIFDYLNNSFDIPLQGSNTFSLTQDTGLQIGRITNNSTYSNNTSVFNIAKILVYFSTSAYFDGETQSFPIDVSLTKIKSEFNISSTTQTETSTAKLTMPHEAFNRLANVYGDLTVKSDLYSREDASVNPISSGVVGSGALKGMLNGLQLRNAFFLTTNPTLLTQSFKSLFLSLKSIDNIGWGFSTESGVIYIRVENWKWFYKSDVILSIDNPKEKTRKPILESIYSRAKVGYKKFFAVEDINSVDTIHTERSYNNGLKAIDKEIQYLSDLVADPFAIEVTRRLSLLKDTKDWKFDDNVFVLAMCYNEAGTSERTFGGMCTTIFLSVRHYVPFADYLVVGDVMHYDSGTILADYSSFWGNHAIIESVFDIMDIGDVVVYNGGNFTITSKSNYGIETSPSLPSSDINITFSKVYVVEAVDYIYNSVNANPNFPPVELYLTFTTNLPIDASYSIEQGYVSSSNFTSPNSTFNTRISPARNALRLADSLFGIDKPEYRLTASKGNVAASGKSVSSSYYTLGDLSEDSVLAESADIAQPTRLLSGEKIEVEYPISFTDYQTVKSNPYGTVVIDGEDTFIEKMTYSPITSLAKLTLLVKA